MTAHDPEPEGVVPGLSSKEARDLAGAHQMTQLGVRPKFWSYVRDMWRHRNFLGTLAAADSVARHQNNYLGQFWSVLYPIMLAGAYFLVFGVLLGTRGGTDNFVGFLTIGLFTFIYMSAGWNSAAKSLISNLPLVRSLRFPRAIVPLSVVLAELLATLPAFGILLVIALATGEPITPAWLLFPVAIVIVAVLTAGMGLLSAPLVHGARDLSNVVPIVTRMLRYTSGVFFSVTYYAQELVSGLGDQWGWIADVLIYQPVAVSLTMMREPLLSEAPLMWQTWFWASLWAVVFFVGGFVVFWRGEARYGRA